MKKVVLLILAGGIILSACNKTEKNQTENTTISNKEDSMSYALGVVIANTLKTDTQHYANLNYDLVVAGMKEMFGSKAKLSPKEANTFLQKYNHEKQMAQMAALKKANEDFLAQNAKKEGVVSLKSGLQYKVINKGNGIQPDTNDIVVVSYKGTLIDGTVFDSTAEGKTAEFKLNKIIPGISQALTKMHEGDEWEVYIPYNLAYGEYGIPNSPIKPYSTLIFRIKLEKVKKQ